MAAEVDCVAITMHNTNLVAIGSIIGGCLPCQRCCFVCLLLPPVMQLDVGLTLCHAQGCARQERRHCCAGVHSSFTREATHPERAALIRLGSLKPRDLKALLVSRSTTVHARASLSLHDTVVSSLGGVCADIPALDMAALQQLAAAATASTCRSMKARKALLQSCMLRMDCVTYFLS